MERLSILGKSRQKIIKADKQPIAIIGRNGYDGIGKLEPLHGDLSGWWSRRIDEKNRLAYQSIENNVMEFSQCKGHCGDN